MLPYSWIIAALPLLAFVMIVFFLNRNNKISSGFSIAMVLTSFVLSCVVLIQVLNDPEPKEYWVEWIVFGDGGMFGTDQPQDQPEPEFIIEDTLAEQDTIHEEMAHLEEDTHLEETVLDTALHEPEIIADTAAVEHHVEEIEDTTLVAAVHHDELSGHDSEHHLQFKEPQRHGKKGSFVIPMGIYIDPLTAIMLMVVTIVAALGQIYSLGYMAGDPRFARDDPEGGVEEQDPHVEIPQTVFEDPTPDLALECFFARCRLVHDCFHGFCLTATNQFALQTIRAFPERVKRHAGTARGG